jgi:sugar phosphate isomerase/epimerase
MSRNQSRRSFLQATVTSVSASQLLLAARYMNANPLNLPIGLQLYTVGKEMDSDPAGTTKRIAEIGYKNVELSPLGKTPLSGMKKLLADNGLKSPSGHFMLPDLMKDLQRNIDAAKEIGQEDLIVTVPFVADPSRLQGTDQMAAFLNMLNSLTLDDWKWNAEQFNKIGEQVKKAGLQLGYHNHNFEFKNYGSTTGYDEFLRLTDPNLVKLELDCGWATVAGRDPVTYLDKFPDRYRYLHIKDFKKGFTPCTTLMNQDSGAPVPTELGRGSIDYRRIFAAASKTRIRAYYVEQEPPFTEMPALDAIKIDYDYLKTLHA